MSRRLALNLAFLSVIALVNAAAECYFPNGDLARLDTPCYADGGASHCCGPNSLCLTNGLCLAVVAPFTLSRGSCTDKTWGPSCPSICGKSQPVTYSSQEILTLPQIRYKQAAAQYSRTIKAPHPTRPTAAALWLSKTAVLSAVPSTTRRKSLSASTTAHSCPALPRLRATSGHRIRARLRGKICALPQTMIPR